MKYQAIIAAMEKIQTQHAERERRLSAAFSELNSDILPNVDKYGRLHAPIDGYVCPVEWDVNEKLYGKGEYLPFPFDPDREYFFSGNWSSDCKDKVKASVDAINDCKAWLESNGIPAAVGCGKAWQQGEQSIAYAYVSAQWKTLVDAICYVLNASMQQEPEVYIEGKQTITGTVVSVKTTNGYYGIQTKMLVITDDGIKAYGTVPASIENVEKGMQVRFSATFEKGDKGMTWFKRPTKASIL